ncbi:MAG: hypothetical protein FWC54_06715 [Actinomycetia bacterium]|nr:hypothetical protein [Actinomycetes bacterium]
MGSAVKPELRRPSDGAAAFERILERETQLLAEIEDARKRGRSLVAHAPDDKDVITKQALEEARVRAQKESASIQDLGLTKIEALQRQHVQERAALRSELERTVDPAVDMVVAMVTGVVGATQGSDA